MKYIKELIQDKLNDGHSLKSAQNLVAEEIFINKIASSEMAEHVTLKGGIVMYNLSKSNRRVTQDIDFDLIRYSIDKESIVFFIDKMNAIDNDFTIFINGDMENLHQEDYQGVRVFVGIKDKKNSVLKLKLDIGVHTYSAIEQSKISFSFSSNKEGVSVQVNPTEQIFAEKLISLARLGTLSTRFKDIYDLFYMIRECELSKNKVSNILKLFLANSKKKPNTIYELQSIVEDTLNNDFFIKEACKPASKWIDDDIDVIRKTLIDYVLNL